MGRINDTILVNIDLAEDTNESIVEVVTHIGTTRTVLNIFRGDHAELIYQTLINKHLVDPYSQLRSMQEEKYPPRKFLATDKDIVLDKIEEVNQMLSNEPKTYLERVTFKDEEDAKIVLEGIKSTLHLYGSMSLGDFRDMAGCASNYKDHGYIFDPEAGDLAVLQNDEGWYIYPLEFKFADGGISPASQAAMLL